MDHEPHLKRCSLQKHKENPDLTVFCRGVDEQKTEPIAGIDEDFPRTQRLSLGPDGISAGTASQNVL